MAYAEIKALLKNNVLSAIKKWIISIQVPKKEKDHRLSVEILLGRSLPKLRASKPSYIGMMNDIVNSYAKV